MYEGLEQVLVCLEQSLPRIRLELNLRKCVLVYSAPPEDESFPRLAEVMYVEIQVRKSRIQGAGRAGGRKHVGKPQNAAHAI